MRLCLLLALFAVGHSARAQDGRSYVSWSADPVVVGADGHAVVRLTGVVAPGWKMYALTSPAPAPALRVSLDSAAGRLRGPVRHVDAPQAAFDSLLAVPVEQLTGRARMDLPVHVTADGSRSDLPVSVRFAVCDASICLAPRTVVVPVALRRVETAPEEPVAVQAPKATPEPPQLSIDPAPADTVPAPRNGHVPPEPPAAPSVVTEPAGSADDTPFVWWWGAGAGVLLVALALAWMGTRRR